MPNIGAPELIIILVIALLILGPGKLPEVGASLGKSIREFRKASTDIQESVKVNVDTSPLPATPQAPAAEAQVAQAQVAQAAAAGALAAQGGQVASPVATSAPAEPAPASSSSADSSTVAS
jgi:TatA/E family protein of Tat protein translocase